MNLTKLARYKALGRILSMAVLAIACLMAVVLLSGLWSASPDVELLGDVQPDSVVRRYSTDNPGNDTFRGWTWLVNASNVALGLPNDGPLRDFQYKIHFLDEQVGIWNGGEFFCDPDEVIFFPSSGEVAYLPYLAWEKDTFIDAQAASGRLSLRYKPADLTKEALLGIAPLATDVDIRINKTLQAETGFIDSQIYLTNNQTEPLDIVYITQDAAYMYLPDGDQAKVAAVDTSGTPQAQPDYSYGPLERQDIVATYHEDEAFVGGYVVKGASQVWGGVVPEYAFFVTHAPSDIVPGFADVTRRSYADAEAINDYFNKVSNQVGWSPESLKSRMLLFSFKGVQPGETVIADFYQFGARNLDAMANQAKKIQS